MEQYLNIKKSVIISSPAGSGKTERLARRYISLLLSGSRIQNILAITFTDKAAAEMKARIFNILKAEHRDIFMQVQEKMPLMRISTIHSFCLKLLKRFSIELGLDPALEVLDEFNASTLWTEAVYESLMEERDNPGLFFSMIVNRGIKGWGSLFRIINDLHLKRPHPDLMIKENHPSDGEGKNILAVYERCLRRYTEKKKARNCIDFNDIELYAYEALLKHPQWENILYSFDEHTDHILVDEFQDTSSLQWKLIDKLTEEWRSGIGAKRDRGKIPTIFLVGDEKQSIYLFRGANVGIFQEARTKLDEWLPGEFCFEAIKENYRSLPEIVDFVNRLFARLMPSSQPEHWRTRYTPFEATRKGTGRVELIFVEDGGSTKQNREREADALARRIAMLNMDYEIIDGEIKRKCTYGDMAVLLRRRTYLPVYEDAFRRHGIPFVVVKGIGFYEETEVAFLRELFFLLIDPYDDYSLFCLLRSPLFGIDYPQLLRLAYKITSPLFRKLAGVRIRGISQAYRIIARWIERSATTPYAVILEDALTETGGWKYFGEPQRHANIRKFIGLIEEYESQGLSGLEIREKLILSRMREEPKAHINTSGMNAVQIMTIHAAKGLQFPVVFLPALDEDIVPKSTSVVIDEDKDRIFLAYENDARRRKDMNHFFLRKEKEIEEEKRIFYVATTRAQDFLCMLAAPKKEKIRTSRLKYITDNLGFLPSLTILKETDLEIISTQVPHPAESSLPDRYLSGIKYTKPLHYEPSVRWSDVTEDLDIGIRHGDDWVTLGRVFHILFEELAKGITPHQNILARSQLILGKEINNEVIVARLGEIIRNDLAKLEKDGFLQTIILPQKDAFSELPFILRKGCTIYRGRIDRIIVRNSTLHIYDYKTFPVLENELPELIEHYRFQMDIYKEAAAKVFSMRTQGYLLFTHIPALVEM